MENPNLYNLQSFKDVIREIVLSIYGAEGNLNLVTDGSSMLEAVYSRLAP